jgi:hypothetical protein
MELAARGDRMADINRAEASDPEFVDRRQEIRVVVRIPGRFSLASRRDINGNRRQYACRAVNISPIYMVLATPVNGPIGERVIAYFEELGKFQGRIIRIMSGGFVIRVAATDHERDKFVRKLIWLEQNKNSEAPEVRMHKRIVPEDPLSTLIFSDGSMMGCFVIDMSASGAAVSADIVPEIGTAVVVGKVPGTVLRHLTEGFAIKFNELQNPRVIEQLVIHKC